MANQPSEPSGPEMTREELIDHFEYLLGFELSSRTKKTFRMAIAALRREGEAVKACKAVEEWWLREGMNHFIAAPACMFMARQVADDQPGA